MEILCVYCLAEFDIIKKFPISTISTKVRLRKLKLFRQGFPFFAYIKVVQKRQDFWGNVLNSCPSEGGL